MYCPSCRAANRPNSVKCENCQSDMGGARQRVSVGSQFLFVDASERQPVILSLDGEEPQTFTIPTLLSRHQYEIGLGEHAQYRRRPPGSGDPRPELPRLPAPTGPDLTAVVTERKIYRPRETAHIFVVAPDAPSDSIEIEVHLAGQQITKEQIELDETGVALRPFADLEEGEYMVLARRPSCKEPATCTFSVAEFTLSPLIALLEEHRYEAGDLRFGLRVLALSEPYTGWVELALQSGERVVETKKARIHHGRVEASFDVEAHEGPFRLQVTTDEGEVASVFFPGTTRSERERITLCPLGTVAEAGVLPGDDTVEVRGLHIGYGTEENTPLRLESAVGRTGRLMVGMQAAVLQVVTFDPLTNETQVHEYREVATGDAIEFPVQAPCTLFTVGMLAPRLPYEAWGVVVHPTETRATLAAPRQAEPGAEIAIRVEADRPAACLLLVYDARLEHESPLPKLGAKLMEGIRASTGNLKEQTSPSLDLWYASHSPFPKRFDEGWRSMVEPMAMLRSTTADTALHLKSPDSTSEARYGLREAIVATETQPVRMVAVPSREDFPEVAYMELLTVRDVAERTVALGDQIGTWRCRAYLVAGMDVLEVTADVEAAKAIYAELDLPAIAGEGDDVQAGVRYHTQQPATMTITLPDGQSVTGAVMGHGTQTFHLTEPGDVTVHIFSQEAEDWTRREVKPPGVETVTASRLEILRRGETLRADRIVVYPGPASVLAETIEALGRYPFG
ncbi:MAG: hypothetical protein PVH11_01055 [Anaerolineae bacterium]